MDQLLRHPRHERDARSIANAIGATPKDRPFECVQPAKIGPAQYKADEFAAQAAALALKHRVPIAQARLILSLLRGVAI